MPRGCSAIRPKWTRRNCGHISSTTAFYNLHLGRDWKLFQLVRSPSPVTLPTVLTRSEVARLFGAIREEQFRTVLRLIYACGLRVSEATALEVTQIKRDGPRLARIARRSRAARPWHLRCPHRGAFALRCVGRLPRGPPTRER